MPILKNTNVDEKTLVIDGLAFPYNVEITTKRYYYHTDLTLVNHAPRNDPVKKLYDGAIGGWTALTGLAEFNKVTLRNSTDAVVTVTVNEDATNQFSLAAGETFTVEGEGRIANLNASGAGAGSLVALGYRSYGS